MNIKVKIITGIAVITLLWMSSGLFNSHSKSESAHIVNQSNLKIISSTAEVKTKYISFAATAYAHDRVRLVSQVNGAIVKKFVADGQKLKKGDKIVQIENQALIGRVEHAKNAFEEANLQYEAAKKLKKQSLGSELDVEKAQTNLRASQAEFWAAQTALKNSTIIAPFDGIIDTILVQEGDLVSTLSNGRDVIGDFINLNNIEARAYLSQSERNEINNSSEGIIDAKNSDIPVKISFIASSADEKTGTFLVKAIGKNTLNIADGEEIKLKIRIGDIKSHNIPISALRIDKDGDLSIRSLDHNNQLKEFKVSIVDEDSRGVWITGIPEKLNVVLAG